MSYERVIPRDLFNEANLLKCIGRLYIETERFSSVALEHDGSPFNIEQSEDDGSISVENVHFIVRGKTYRLFRPLNSRESFPLYMQFNSTDILVFTEDGKLTAEMLTWIMDEDTNGIDVPCMCSDPSCLVEHIGDAICGAAAVVTVYRIDMEDETGTPMCQGCADDALESGVFTTKEAE